MQNTYGLGVPFSSGGRKKSVYKVDKVEEQKTIARQEAMGMVTNRIDHEKTVSYLMEAGYSRREASNVVSELEISMERLKRQKAHRKMVFGGLWLVTGVMMALLVYSTNNLNAGFILSGILIVFGIIHFYKGVTLGSG